MALLSREVKKVALAICNGFVGPRNAELKKLIVDEDWVTLVNTSVDPRSYANAEDYFSDVACVSFLRKYELLPTGIDKVEKARSNFWQAEKQCFCANKRLYKFIYKTFGSEDEFALPFIAEVRKNVRALIGTRPPSPFEVEGRFGKGATYDDRGRLITIPDKMQSQPTCTPKAQPYLIPWLKTLWGRCAMENGRELTLRRGNRFTTVPKDGRTDRGISIECSINVFYQLAYGRAMRETLKKRTNHLIDLDTAQELHRQIACVSSKNGSFATIDLSQASDTVSKALVRLLLPHQWYVYLDALRSSHTTIQDSDGRIKTVELEKFSSMGNGYTFELETVLFLAISLSAITMAGGKGRAGINTFAFGDDLIVPTEFAGEVMSALTYFGLTINKEKTFVDGPFRESCGGDFFLGTTVRPFFLKKECNEPQDFFSMANGIRRMAFDGHSHGLRWHSARHAWFAAVDSVPRSLRGLRGPQALGDICIHDEPGTWTTRFRGGLQYIRVYSPTVAETPMRLFDPNVQLASRVYGVKVSKSQGFIARGNEIKYRTTWVAAPQRGLTPLGVIALTV